MLSTLAQAQLGRAALRFSRTTLISSPSLRAAPLRLTASSWTRSYAKNHGKPSNSRQPARDSASPSKPSESSRAAPSSSTSPSSPESPSEKSSVNASEGPESTSPEAKSSTEPAEEPIPFHKLPDLTRGIPSTFEQEMNERAGKAAPSALEAIEQEEAANDRSGREREEYIPTSERNRRWWTRFVVGWVASGALVGTAYLGRGWDTEEEAKLHSDIPNGWSPMLWWARVRARMGESVSYYQDPAFDKLLPDPDPSFERPYTLCISLEDMLVHNEWTREHGWRVAKRPGMDYFVRYLSQYYELVLFTTVPFGMGEPLMRKLDPFRLITWPLYREATKYEDGELVKDLSYLNRDLSKVIIIDSKAEHVRKQPENAIVLKPWKGDPQDTDLVGLIPFLEYIHTMQYEDVRKILKSFEGKHIPTEFARREAILRKEHERRIGQKKHAKPSGFASLGSALGLDSKKMSMMVSPEGEQNPTEAFAQGKMLQDIARERGQRNYEMLDKEIRENGEKWLKAEAEANEKLQQEAMNSMMSGFGGWFVGGNKGGENKS